MAIAHLRAARDGLTAELHRIDVTLALLLAETPATPAVAPAPTPPRAAPQTRRRRSTIDAREAVRRYQGGDTVPTIAKALGCTPKRIYAALDEAGIERRDDRHGHSGGGNRKQPTDDDPQLVANVRHLYFDENLGQLEVAQALGIGVKRVQNLMARHQMPVRPPASAPGAPGRLTLEHRADVVRLYGEGESTGTLAERFGISPPSIRKILLREGVTLRSHREAAAAGRERAARE